ncbi:MAG: hypothetical protein J6V80_04815 [Clostridia bacterium]|nr:hypothetical protein [Clostridia bacterium]
MKNKFISCEYCINYILSDGSPCMRCQHNPYFQFLKDPIEEPMLSNYKEDKMRIRKLDRMMLLREAYGNDYGASFTLYKSSILFDDPIMECTPLEEAYKLYKSEDPKQHKLFEELMGTTELRDALIEEELRIDRILYKNYRMYFYDRIDDKALFLGTLAEFYFKTPINIKHKRLWYKKPKKVILDIPPSDFIDKREVEKIANVLLWIFGISCFMYIIYILFFSPFN